MTEHSASALWTADRGPAVVIAMCVLAAALALPACLAPAVDASPTPVVTPTSIGLAPDQAAARLRQTVTGAKPLLIPTGIPAKWTADVQASASAFKVTYRAPDGAQSVSLAIALANLPLPGPTAMQTHPRFHGDGESLYQVADPGNARSDRWLMWTEPGRWSQPGSRGVPYLLSATGTTDQDFWQFAETLHPNQL